MQMLFMAHSGLRYLVLLAGLAALVYYAYALAVKKGDDLTGRRLGSLFAALLGLQLIVGLMMIAFGLFYSALIGHMFMMVAATGVVHMAMSLARSPRHAARANTIRLMGIGVALILIAGGIMSIGRSVFGSGSPTMIP